MKRPFVTLCIFLLIGIIAGHIYSLQISISYVLLMSITSVVILLLYERWFTLFLLITVLILGAYLYGRSIVGDMVLGSAPENIKINAKILDQTSYKSRFSQYEIEIISILHNNTDKAIKLNKNAQLKIYGASIDNSNFILNDTIEINNGKITKVLGNIDTDNSNSYDFFLKSKGIEYIIEVNPNNITNSSKSQYNFLSIRSISNKTQIYLEDFLDSTLDFENSQILKSIMFGNQGYLSRDRLDIFSKTGTAHIMAVSGLHVGLIVLIIERLLKSMKIGRNNILYITAAFLIFYSYMVGFPISIVRAGAMYILFLVSYFLHRRYDSINALFFIAFVLLIYRPMTIFSVSFQLSFSATLSILLLSPIINKALNKKVGFLSTLMSVTLAAQIGTIPIMAYHFKQISLISLVTNLLIVPFLAPILFITFASILVGLLFFELGFLMNQITNHLLNYINWISIKCAIIPYGSFEVEDVKIIYMLGYYILVASVYFVYMQKQYKQTKKSNLKEEGLVNTYEL